MKRRFTNEQVSRILREMAESRSEPVKDLCKRPADGRAHDRAIRSPWPFSKIELARRNQADPFGLILHLPVIGVRGREIPPHYTGM